MNNVVTVLGEQWRDSAMYIHVSIPLPTPLPSKLPHNLKESSMCYTVGPCRRFNFLMRGTTRSCCKGYGKNGELGPSLQSVCPRLSGKENVPFVPTSSSPLLAGGVTGASRPCPLFTPRPPLKESHSLPMNCQPSAPPFPVCLLQAWGMSWVRPAGLMNARLCKPSAGLCHSISVKWTC